METCRFHSLEEVKVGRLWISADTSPGLSVAAGVGRLMEWVLGEAGELLSEKDSRTGEGSMYSERIRRHESHLEE